jgi:hypothetical protein
MSAFGDRADIGQVAVFLTIHALANLPPLEGRTVGSSSKITELLRHAPFQKVEHFFCRDCEAAGYAFHNL